VGSVSREFPPGFVWGSATAALQVEGAAQEDGRGPSMWDVFCHEHPERIFQQATPDVACDHYHRYAGDVRLMKEMGHTGYRLSISWPRLFPIGRGPRNAKGFDFYDRLFDALLTAAVAPNVTLYHWDLPQTLAENGGWENPSTADAFAEYAAACFERWGDRVKLWATLNEPSWSTLNGYVTGLHPPGKQDYRAAIAATWNLLRAHALAVRLFYEKSRGGSIGIALNLSPIRPATDSEADRAAARIADGAFNRWFLEPVLLGRFPEDMLALYQEHDVLPEMSADDLALLAERAVDFVGVNYYFPHHASADASDTQFFLNTSGRPEEECTFSIKGLFRFLRNPRGRYTDWGWEVDPSGLHELLVGVARLQAGVPIYVTENGIGVNDQLVDGTVDDQARIDFVSEHLAAVHEAIQEGANVRGYYMWSLMDNFSWLNGYKKRYGFLYVDRQSLTRHRKKSSFWFEQLARSNQL
jgi:6-phospho-beta-glucosidase